MTPWACSNTSIHYSQHPCHHESYIERHASLNYSHSVLRYKPDWSPIMSWRTTILLICAHVFDVRRTLWMWYPGRCMHGPSENFSLEHTQTMKPIQSLCKSSTARGWLRSSCCSHTYTTSESKMVVCWNIVLTCDIWFKHHTSMQDSWRGNASLKYVVQPLPCCSINALYIVFIWAEIVCHDINMLCFRCTIPNICWAVGGEWRWWWRHAD